VPGKGLEASLFNAAVRVYPAAGNANANETTLNAVAIAIGVTATLTVAITMLKEWNSTNARRSTTTRNLTTLKSDPMEKARAHEGGLRDSSAFSG
jgi:hypothetical protein